MFYPFNPTLGQKFQSSVLGVHVDGSYIAHIQVSGDDAVAADVDGIHAAINASGDTVVVVDDEFTNPRVPRNITATVAATAESEGNIKAVKVKVYGTNYSGENIVEELAAFTADTAGTVSGAKAFKSVTKVEIPAMDGTGVNVKIGWGDALGLPYKLSHNTVLAAFLDNVLEATAATVTTSMTDIEGNTIDLSSALNGKIVDAYVIV